VRDGKEKIVNFTPRMCAINGEALRQAALAVLGILVQREVQLADDVKTKRLVPLSPAWLSPARPMHLVHLRDRQPHQTCSVLLNS
jgi:DNA-binding transcriptional LysR family regulator